MNSRQIAVGMSNELSLPSPSTKNIQVGLVTQPRASRLIQAGLGHETKDIIQGPIHGRVAEMGSFGSGK